MCTLLKGYNYLDNDTLVWSAFGDYTNPYQYSDRERGGSSGWFPDVTHQSREWFWFPARVNIMDPGQNFRIVFRAYTVGQDAGDIAIDDVSLIGSKCGEFIERRKLWNFL